MNNSKKKRIEEEEQKRKEKKLDDFKMLLKSGERWNIAENLRKYINAIKSNAIKNNNNNDETKNRYYWQEKEPMGKSR